MQERVISLLSTFNCRLSTAHSAFRLRVPIPASLPLYFIPQGEERRTLGGIGGNLFQFGILLPQRLGHLPFGPFTDAGGVAPIAPRLSPLAQVGGAESRSVFVRC